MNTEILFEEKQKFNQWWIRLILIGINLYFLFGLFNAQIFGLKPINSAGLLITLLVSILIIVCRLETQITKQGINVRFFPFQLSFRHFEWKMISRSFVRQYDPIGEYGGWGIRLGLFGKGKALNVSGDIGLQLEFSDSKKLLIGTNKPDELLAILKGIGQLKK